MNEITRQLRCPEGEKGKQVATMMNRTNTTMTVHAVKQLSLKNKDHILEIGHGNAGHLPMIFAQADNLTYLGIDISPLMTSEAIAINQALVENQQATFHTYNETEIPCEDQEFDAVFSVNTLYFWKNPPLFLSEIARVMKPTARFVLTFADAQFMRTLPYVQPPIFTLYTTSQVEKLVQASPLTLQCIETKHETIENKLRQPVQRTFYSMICTKKIL